MDAPCGIPRIGSLNILDSVDKIIRSLCLALSQILRLPQQVGTHRPEILDCLFHDGGLRILLLHSLLMQSLRSPIQHLSLRVAEPVLCRVHGPVVVAHPLLARLEVTVSFLVKVLNILSIILGAL